MAAVVVQEAVGLGIPWALRIKWSEQFSGGQKEAWWVGKERHSTELLTVFQQGSTGTWVPSSKTRDASWPVPEKFKEGILLVSLEQHHVHGGRSGHREEKPGHCP